VLRGNAEAESLSTLNDRHLSQQKFKNKNNQVKDNVEECVTGECNNSVKWLTEKVLKQS